MRQPVDYCPACEEGFNVEPDEDGLAFSYREELDCECGAETFCQCCPCDKCAMCDRVLCDACGGCDFDGDRFCSKCLPVPVLSDPLLEFCAALENFSKASVDWPLIAEVA